ncbi:calcium-activated chloride channel regulator 1-like isoform X2 [Grus americana]|uniref:calcium-activated chloride channel regulator 1-like isoform X2 n=1 Tax=Grus americana TaxID=9117 RepID=UPI00240839F7|nr:calcium-activated chloride channel regulator 1-like isoform X2 [Grus americana]
MRVTGSLIFLLSFQLLHLAKSSMVWLNKNGYEDLVVAINPQVPEDTNIILNTMNMIKNASHYLFETTKHRFFFKSVKIIIPKTWKKTPNYSRLKTESYDKADVIIADPYIKHADDPYTLQYGGCREKGRYIRFTPNFLLNDNLTNVYGEKGRVFVHEWAHFRWGVFNEYNDDVPFYVSRNSASVEAVSCPAGLAGIPVFQDCRGDKCESRSCRYDGQLYEKGCIFIPDIQQNISCCVMHSQYIPSVVEFCDKNTHNSEAPNMQNKICNHKSTWEVIMESDDFHNSAVVNASAPPSETNFRLLQTQDRAVALVLDVSGSMSMLIADKMNTTYGSEIVLLTDGEDSHISACFDVVKESGAKIHTIALGPEADKDLEELSELTGGLKLYAVDAFVPTKLIETFSAIISGSGDISKQSIQLESKELAVQPSEWMNTTVPVDKTVGNDTFFSIAWNRSQPFFFLKDSKGKVYGSSDFTIRNSNTARLSISGTAEVGNWEFCIKNVHRATQTLSVTVTSRPSCSNVPPVSTAAHTSRAKRAFNPVVVYAEVSQGFLPVLGATVIATIEKDGAAAVTLELLDNGAGADMTKNDGIYSRYFTSLQGTGRYSLKVNARGTNTTTRLSLQQNRASYIPGYRKNGKIYLNAPRPKFADKEIQVKLGSFSRISTSSFLVNTEGDSAPIYPPCKVTDLRARTENKTIVLSWTAPGGDFDNGKADHYIIKSSENLLDLRNHFDRATSVNSSNLIPQEAGREETFEIKPENFTTEKDTIIYFALRAVDDTNLTSEVSNIAQATWFIPSKASVPLDYDSNDGANSTVIAAIVALCVVVVCTVVTSTLCVLQKQKGRVDIETMQKHV